MFLLLLLMSLFAFSCSEPNIQTVEEGDGSVLKCSPGSYPGLLKLWQDRNGNDEEPEHFVEPTPNCKTEIEIQLSDDEEMTSFAECTMANGRILLFDFIGRSDELNLYFGRVMFTKPNGQQQQGAFDGSCTQNEDATVLSFEWFMTVSTPHGEIEHHGQLTSPVTESD